MRRRVKWGLIGGASAVAVTVVAVLVVVKLADRPASVSPSFRPPIGLSRSAEPLAPDRIAFDSDRSGNFELMSMAADGTDPKPLTRDQQYDSWWPRISPDGRTILFYRTPAGSHDRDFTLTSLWVIAADGTDLRELRPAGLDGWTVQGHAEWSPDGTKLVMFGGSRYNPQIYLTNATGQQPLARTDRGGVNLDPSFSPDGSNIVFVGCPHAICQELDYEIYRLPTTGGQPTRLTNDDIRDHDPYYSPDGRHLAWLSQLSTTGIGIWDIRIAANDGANSHRLVGDDAITSKPQWTADSQRIYTHRIAPGATKFDIYRIKPDGTDLHVITGGQPGNNEYPSVIE